MLHNWIALSSALFNLTFFVTTMTLFPYAAYKKHRFAYLEYKPRFFIQATGTFIMILVCIYMDCIGIKNVKSARFPYSEVLELGLLHWMGVYIFVISKRPQDTFMHFSKRPDIQFSIFQYPRFCVADNRFKIQNNKQELEEKLREINKDGKMLVVLDEDDYLNMKDTLNRYKLGVDTNYLVKHLGQGDFDFQTLETEEHYPKTSEYVPYDELMRSTREAHLLGNRVSIQSLASAARLTKTRELRTPSKELRPPNSTDSLN